MNCVSIEARPFASKAGGPLIFVPFVGTQGTFKSHENRGRPIKQRFLPDFVCYDRIIIEIKALSALTDEQRAQVLNYPAGRLLDSARSVARRRAFRPCACFMADW